MDATPTNDVRANRVSRADIRSCLVIALFGMMILAPLAVQFGRAGGDNTRGNRVLAPLPKWEGFGRLREMTRTVDAYLDDHFGLRDQLVRLNSLVRYHLGVSSTPKVVIGDDGWLFYAAEKIMEQHTGEDVFTPSQLENWVGVMIKNRDWLASRGIPFIIVVAPDKSTIYPEKLPAYPRRPQATTRLDQLIERLRGTDLDLVDPRAAMLAARSKQELYSKGDSHWNQFGAYIAYSMLMERVAKYFPALQPVKLVDYRVARGRVPADLAFLLALQNDLTYTADVMTPRRTHQLRKDVRPPGANWGWPIDFVRTDFDETRPRLLAFGDSFTDYVLGPTFLYETFRDPVRTHHNGGTLNFRLVDEVKPDLVILQLAERYLVLPPGPALVN